FIRVFLQCKLDNVPYRISLLKESKETAKTIYKAIDKNDFSQIDALRPFLDRHVQKRRVILLALAARWKPVLSAGAYQSMMKMNKDFAGECLDTVLDLLALRGRAAGPGSGSKTPTAEAYEEEIYRLNASLNRANNLVTRLQDSYEEQMLEIRAEEEARIITMLNSEKYGYILDLLLTAQDGIRQLRKKGPIPFEIKGVQSLVRRLQEFVEDCGVTPMLEMGEELSVLAKEIDGFYYDGAPFKSSDELKNVVVISPGWEISEKKIVISYPRVKEILEEN
ncbi:MAG: hypothetical protein K2O18_11935, partial [Oscillospiraceae bacterium]|nr:hypothetical protein [Oscillospiraceae bacterium]